MQNTKAYIMLVCATLFWAGNFMVGKYAFLVEIPPLSLVFYCFGHHHLGWTLGPISGKIVSGMIAKENTNLNLAPYSSTRFN